LGWWETVEQPLAQHLRGHQGTSTSKRESALPNAATPEGERSRTEG